MASLTGRNKGPPSFSYRDLRRGYLVAEILATAGIFDLVGWAVAEYWFNQYCWSASCPYETVGLPLSILFATGPLLLLLSAVVAVVAFETYSTEQHDLPHAT